MKRFIGAFVILGIVALSLAVAVWAGPGQVRGTAATAQQVGLVRVEGMILSGGGSFFGSGIADSDTVVKRLDEAAADDSIRAVVLRVNSPGGGVVASWEIGEAIKRVQAAGKPVVVSMGEAAASGGYWISAVADKIVASPATVTGSIGVIMSTRNLTEIYEKIGYKEEVFTSGPHKDMGSPARELTEEERSLMQGMVNEIYEDFVQVVAEGRNMDPARVRAVADGRVITGREALELGLVDELGDLKRAVQLAAEMANLPGEPEVRELNGADSFLEELLGSSASVSASFARRALFWLLLGATDPAASGLYGAQAREADLLTVR